jgi:hypothetical protein
LRFWVLWSFPLFSSAFSLCVSLSLAHFLFSSFSSSFLWGAGGSADDEQLFPDMAFSVFVQDVRVLFAATEARVDVDRFVSQVGVGNLRNLLGQAVQLACLFPFNCPRLEGYTIVCSVPLLTAIPSVLEETRKRKERDQPHHVHK